MFLFMSKTMLEVSWSSILWSKLDGWLSRSSYFIAAAEIELRIFSSCVGYWKMKGFMKFITIIIWISFAKTYQVMSPSLDTLKFLLHIL